MAEGMSGLDITAIRNDFPILKREINGRPLVYLDNALEARRAQGRLNGKEDLIEAIMEGAVLRVRPKAMTVAIIFAGLIPIMLGSGTGSEVMSRLAAPMVGGVLTDILFTLLVLPVLLFLGTRDPIVGDAATAAETAGEYPDIEITILDSGHLVAVEHRETVNAKLVEFLNKHGCLPTETSPENPVE